MEDRDKLKINTLEVMMEQNTKEHGEIRETLKEINGKIDELGDKFASKWVETALKWVLGTIGGAFIIYVVRWILLLELR